MDSFKESTTSFHCNPGLDCLKGDAKECPEFSNLLDIYVHHARNLHNICIYNNQDVYAKFSLTYSPDEMLCTGIIIAGGKNPEFNENLQIKLTQPDAVLKCEIWMLSRARNYLEDQLLGFTLVSMSQVAAVGEGKKLTQDFNLSSTDLFHSPAGTIRLTLALNKADPSDASFAGSTMCSSSIASEVVFFEPAGYERIEFPDIKIARENQRMVSEYFDMAKEHNIPTPMKPDFLISPPAAPFLHLGPSSQSSEDYDMALNSGDENNGQGGTTSPNGSLPNSSLLCSTITSFSDDRISVNSLEKKNQMELEASDNNSDAEVVQSSARTSSPKTPTSKITPGAAKNKEASPSNKKEDGEDSSNPELTADLTVVLFKSPTGDINLEVEQRTMQQQIVDMYMRSMQQFTESLAKMKLPMDIDMKPEDSSDAARSQDDKQLGQDSNRKNGSRVFYGSRAFF